MIYLDHAAATPMDTEVLKKMLPFFRTEFGNASGIYRLGRDSRLAIEQARKDIAQILQCKTKEIIFVSGGTEANNWAIFGLAAAYQKKGKHIISSAIEHYSVYEPLRQLKEQGYDVTFLPVDNKGLISEKDLKKNLRKDTILVSVMYANNEIGTIQNIAAMGKILQAQDIIFHTDACQAAGALPLNVQELHVDAMTLNGGKIYGPKGIGILYIKEKIQIVPLFFGGGQEFRMRAGTENIPAVIGMAEALKKADLSRKNSSRKLIKIRDYFIKEVIKIPSVFLNGTEKHRLPNNINIAIKGVSAESLLLRLDMEGIYASAGSACSSGLLEPSHVLKAIGLSKDLIQSSIRLSLGKNTTKKEIDTVLKILKKLITELRSITTSTPGSKTAFY